MRYGLELGFGFDGKLLDQIHCQTSTYQGHMACEVKEGSVAINKI